MPSNYSKPLADGNPHVPWCWYQLLGDILSAFGLITNLATTKAQMSSRPPTPPMGNSQADYVTRTIGSDIDVERVRLCCSYAHLTNCVIYKIMSLTWRFERWKLPGIETTDMIVYPETVIQVFSLIYPYSPREFRSISSLQPDGFRPNPNP